MTLDSLQEVDRPSVLATLHSVLVRLRWDDGERRGRGEGQGCTTFDGGVAGSEMEGDALWNT